MGVNKTNTHSPIEAHASSSLHDLYNEMEAIEFDSSSNNVQKDDGNLLSLPTLDVVFV